MKIVKFQPDEEGVIYLKNVTAAVWTGLQDHTPTMICVQAEKGETGRDLSFFIKKIGDPITTLELTKQLVIALVDDISEYLIFNEKPQILQIATANDSPGAPPSGPTVPGWPSR